MMQSKNSKSRLLAVALSLSCSHAALAAGDGSLDSMWMDQGQGSGEKPASAAPSAEAPVSTTPASEPSTGSAVGETAAPMCTLDNFKSSTIVSKGGWPGVGPFKPDTTENDYFDEHHNKIHVDLSGQQITRAELALNNRKLSGNSEKDLLDMQMNVDFLLEAVGIKPGKIQELNADLAKNRELLLTAEASPLNLKVGRCSVTIDKKRSLDGAKLDYVIAVNSLDANQQTIREHSATERTAIAETPAVTSEPIVERTPVQPVKPVRKVITTPVAVPVAVSTATTGDTALKAQFAALIGEWQKIKKGAVRTLQTEELCSVLAGKALIRQTDAVKWLVTNKKYYDMNPKGVVVDQLAELSPSKKYMVSAQVREAYKFIDEPSGKVLKEVDDVNKVNYTVEKIAGKWVITDSALLAPTKKASTNKTTR